MPKASRKQAKYDQLVDLLQARIDTELSPGDLLPSERSLCDTYGVSRTTVRLALKELEQLGFIERRHGKGTFVSGVAQEAANLMTSYSFTEQMRELGRVPKTRILEFELTSSPRHIAELLRIEPGEKVYRMRRLRMADNVPMMIERTYLPASEFLGLSIQDVSSKPLYDIIEKDFFESIRIAEEEFCASVARGEEADLLDISEGAAVLRLYRLTYNAKNTAIEYTRSVARADQFRYKVTHIRGAARPNGKER